MKSVPQTDKEAGTMPQVEAAMEAVLTTYAEQLARPTGLIRRHVNLDGPAFARLLVLGWLHDPQASLEALVQFGASLGIAITSQGLQERWTPQAAAFMRALFEVALTQVVVADPVAIPLLSRFGAVVLEDSTQVRLLDELVDVFEGSGNVAGQEARAGCKLQLRLDMLRGRLQCSSLLDGCSADASTPLAALPQVERTLNIRDRGYFDLQRMRQEQEAGHYHLTYFKGGVQLFDEEGQSLDVLLWLAQRKQQGQHGSAQRQVLVGQQRVPMRLLVSPVPPEATQKRRAVLQRGAQKHSKAVNHSSFLLAGYDVALTNVPAELMSLQEALVLLHLRWQIELLIKLWKQDGLLDEWRTHNRWRVLCELYAKLIGLLIQHWVLIISCWHEPHRSLTKAAKAVRSHSIMLAYAYAGVFSMTMVLDKIQQAAQVGSHLNRRKKHPTTSQQVLEPPPTSCDFPLAEVA